MSERQAGVAADSGGLRRKDSLDSLGAGDLNTSEQAEAKIAQRQSQHKR